MDVQDDEDYSMFVAVLEFHYNLRRRANYDILVLATSLNQYLHQVFQHLDFNNTGLIQKHDFVAFLQTQNLIELAKTVGQCDSKKLTFHSFHEYIGKYYSSLSGKEYVPFDCRNTEKEYKDSLKALWTIGRTTVSSECRCHSQNSTILNPSTSTPTSDKNSFTQVTPINSLRRTECIVCSRCQEGNSLMNENTDKPNEELDNLREVIEELRSTIQILDAEKMALRVALEKAKSEESLSETLLANSSSNSSGISISLDEKTENCGTEMLNELKITRQKLYKISEQNMSLVYHVDRMAETFEEAKTTLLSSLERLKKRETRHIESLLLETRILDLQRELEKSRAMIQRNCADVNIIDHCYVASPKNEKDEFHNDGSRVDEASLMNKLQEKIQQSQADVDQLRQENLSLQNYINKLRSGRDMMSEDLRATEAERVRLGAVEEKLVILLGLLKSFWKKKGLYTSIGILLMESVQQILSPDVVNEEDEVMNFIRAFSSKLMTFLNPLNQASTSSCKWVTYV